MSDWWTFECENGILLQRRLSLNGLGMNGMQSTLFDIPLRIEGCVFVWCMSWILFKLDCRINVRYNQVLFEPASSLHFLATIVASTYPVLASTKNTTLLKLQSPKFYIYDSIKSTHLAA
jgi:hypothetical protein